MDEVREQSNTIAAPIGDAEIGKLLEILRKYRAGRQELDQRIQSAEQWWRLRNTQEEKKEGHDKTGYKSKSAWLHNVIQSKHADAMDAYPEPNILPRELGDREEAQRLSKIIPCILEYNEFKKTYSKTWYQKLKYGTGVYKIFWDPQKLNGLGDIAVERVNLLQLYWETGVESIQDSKYLFEVCYMDEDAVREMYPELGDRTLPNELVTEIYPEQQQNVDRDKMVPLINCYYHRGHVLHLVQFLPGILLRATENEPDSAERGIYDHGKYPYVFDVLYPVESSPAGYGYVDLCKQPQVEIDIMKTAMVENTKAGAKPRFWYTDNSGVNTEDFLNLDNPLVRTNSVEERSLRLIEHVPLDGNYLAFLNATIDELRETSGNTDAATGTTPGSVTAASAIAALQEASGKTSRDAAESGYDAYSEIVDMVIELVRQFYDMPRTFRIVGQMGEEDFIEYENSGLQPEMMMMGGMEAIRKPVFDIKVVPQRRSAYTKMAMNDLALQFYGAGFFNPEQCDQALAALQMMDFEGREDVIKTIRKNGALFERMQMITQYAAALAAKYQDGEALMQLQQMQAQAMGQPTPQQGVPQAGAAGMEGNEPTHMVKARNTARGSTVPTEGGGVS